MKQAALLAAVLCFLLCSGCSSMTSADSATENSADSATENSLVLACWIEDWELTQIVQEYNLQHPECPILIKSYYNPDINVDTALQRMNADLLSGTQVDIYCFDSINLQGLINAGYVMDLQPLVDADADFQNGKYFTNILELFQQEGALYEMPSCFQLAGICIPSGLADAYGWTIAEYLALDSDLAQDGKTILSMDSQLMLEYMSQYSMDEFVNYTSCQFETESFYQLLQFINDDAGGNGGEPVGCDTWVFGINSYISDKQALNAVPHYMGYPDAARSGPCVMALTSYGISSTARDVDACWDFLKLTLNDEIYCTLYAGSGFPLSCSALEEICRRYSLSTEDAQSPLYGMTDENDAYYTPLDPEDPEVIFEMIASVTHARFRYSDVFDIICEEGEAFLSGDKSAEETARIVQNRVSILLEEQS